ncbi:MAG: FAD-dependent monooxygenase [Nitrospirae bacterium]|nr:FAD-dependent monooxygenase [Nitrospirota bacterium]
MNSTSVWDVAIVGAGLAGASAAIVLTGKGVRVALIDSRETYPACFKAEKIEPDQADLFRKFGLLEGLLPSASRIHEIVSARSKHVFRVQHYEQYGIFYQDIVNGVRAQIPSSVMWKNARVQDILPGSNVSKVTLMGGETIAARLVVLACGAGSNLPAGLGIRKRMISERHSFCLGFNIARKDGKPFPFDALTYYPDRLSARVAFLTLFPIREVMRANYFVYRTVGEEWVSRFGKHADEQLMQDLPKLAHFTGPFHVSSRVEMCPIDLYRADEGHVQPGLVLVGDVFQGPCPTTGMGMSKVLTDVDALCECVPRWLSTPGMGIEKIEGYYGHPRKTSCDARALRGAAYQRTLSTDPSLRWRIYRELMYLWTRLSGWATTPFKRVVGSGAEKRSSM